MPDLSEKPLSRRELLFRSAPAKADMPDPCIIRLPWADSFVIETACTGCGLCISECSENIITISRSQKATVDFDKGECVFCGACADSCPEPVFWEKEQRETKDPWDGVAVAGQACLSGQGITCEVCKDQCPEEAISFPATLGGSALPTINSDDCTACGACVAPCPVDAIHIDWNKDCEQQVFRASNEEGRHE
ncbi:ferredoxin-type protein NapF [Sneathiella limimaris]|uniref:ferredoxin-type protein NapF n=1 Tax=Sneathiella limimaris TaxID=1964213 RepID=UPI00146ABB61|nr:ferredoxin-type protein NapF [Sneathiella limimaris]